MKFSLHTLTRCTLLLIFISGSHWLIGQPLEVTDGATNPYTPDNLITNIFLGDGVEVINVQFDGDATAVGFFQDGEDEIGIERGLVMTSGAVSSNGATTGVDNPGNQFASTGNSNTVTDADMATIGAPFAPNDVCRYTITFIPTADTLRFRYVFASEEYPEWACSSFNDIFGFFISGPGINGPYTNNSENIAIIPGTNLPVTINNLHPANGPGCPPSFEEFYNDNNGSANLPVYDGFTDVFTAEAVVVPCEEYTIKLVISDVGDQIYDSGVFLEAKSFGTGSLEVDIATVSLDGTITEGCSDGVLTFSLPSPTESDYLIDYNIFGTAINGIDYEFIPTDLFVPQGDSTVSVPIIAFEDGLDEGVETIAIDVQRDICNRDTFFINIRDNELIPPDLGPDLDICAGDTVQLDGTINIPLPPPPAFTNETDIVIGPPGENVFSPVDVFAVQPFQLGPGVIQSVCINVDHMWLSDLDIFLVGPNEQFVELTTDNGSNGDDYIETCFVPGATTPIDYVMPPASGAPYTGTFAAEGVWEDLWSSQENPTNGTWNLLLIDDSNGFEGTLLDWTIVFEPLYQIFYNWTPTTGLSCSDCPNPLAYPDTTTTYFLNAFDSYGCEVFDTITIFVDDVLPAPDVSCGVISDTCITVNWDLIPGAFDYEVSVNGFPWETPNGVLSHTVCGLSFNQQVTIEVRAIDDCSGLIGSATCTTPDCVGANLSLEGVTDVDCFGGNNGQIEIGATSGAPPYVFELGAESNDTGLFTDLEAGVYQVSVTDAGNCTITIDVEVDQPEEILVDPIILEPVSCNGVTDATVTATVTGGTGPYTFDWNGVQFDSIATNIGPGELMVEVTDVNGCTGMAMIELLEPDPITLTSSSTLIICNGDTNGTATISALGGAGNYTYLWDVNANNQDSLTAVDLAAGFYTVTVTDQNGCFVETTVEVSENSPITLDFDTEDASCNGFTDGEATVIPSGGGIGIYFYQWDANANNQTSPTAVDLGPGTYEVTVSDILNCAVTDTITVEAPVGLDVAIDLEPTSCSNFQDGAASVTVSGGQPGYTYEWSDGGNPTPDRDDLAAGVQDVTVTDDNGCFEVIEFEIEAAEVIELTFDSTATACFNGVDGTATVAAMGGSGNYTYLWEDLQTTPTAIGLPAGMIQVTVTDDNGCEATGSVEVLQAEEIELTITGNDALCFEENSGDATIVAGGGIAPYTYLWSDNQNTPTATDLSAGMYEVTVTDANGCEAIEMIELFEPAELTATLDVNNLSCSGNPDGTATVTPDGGTEPYSYLWSDNQTTPTAIGLAAQAYSVTVTDDNGCMVELDLNVGEPEELEVDLGFSNVSCNGGADGTASVEVLNGNPPYNFEWSNSAATADIDNLTAGSYLVTVTDAEGCETVEAVQIEEPEALSAALDQSDALCNSSPDGTASVTDVLYGSTSTPLSEFSFAWSTVPVQTNPQAFGLVGGETYTVTITDQQGCEITETVTIGHPTPVEVTVVDAIEVSCNGGADGAATVSATGGAGDYEFLWDANAGSQSGSTADNLGSGTYTVTVTDGNGCKQITTVDIVEPDPILLDVDVTDVACFGESSGAASATIEGGSAPYDIVWSGGQTGPDIADLIAGAYEVTVTDAKGCVTETTLEVDQPDDPLVADFSVQDVSCPDNQDGIIFMEPFGGTGPYIYSLDQENFVGSSQLVALESGNYNVLVEDANGCRYITGNIFIGEPDPLTVDIGPESVNINAGETFTLTAETNREPVTYNWIPLGPESLDCYDCQQVTTEELQYPATIMVVATDEFGCRAEDKIFIFIDRVRKVLVPTAFSPNGDSNNDLLLVHGNPGVKILEFKVFDRWGELLFQRGDFDINDPAVGWDGNFRSQKMTPGVYMWHVVAEFADGTIEEYTGSTTLIR
jgi:gliding motility-associated-like protein